jgi:hypothetical protein
MALKKLNKSEISALANRMKGVMKSENDKAKEHALASQRPAIEQQARWIEAEILNLSTDAQEFIHSTKSYNASITFAEIVEFLEDRYVKSLVLPYAEPVDTWRGVDKIEETIVLEQIEAESVDALIIKVKEAFTGAK